MEGNAVREFYAGLESAVLVGIEATGAMQWFLELLEELGIKYRVGHPAKIRAQETRKQKHDRRDAGLLLTLLREDRFPEFGMPSSEQQLGDADAEKRAVFATQYWQKQPRTAAD